MRPTTLILASATVSIALLLALGLVNPAYIARLTGEPVVYPLAADIDVVSLAGESLSADGLRGDLLVLDFWATWCGPCIAEIDDYNVLQRDYRSKGVRLVGVAVQSGTAESLRAFAAQYDIKYPVVAGTDELWNRFVPPWGLPTTLLIDRQWRVRRVWTGAGGRKMEQIRAELDALLAVETGPARPD